jgi:hypothetical protein
MSLLIRSEIGSRSMSMPPNWSVPVAPWLGFDFVSPAAGGGNADSSSAKVHSREISSSSRVSVTVVRPRARKGISNYPGSVADLMKSTR